MVRHNHDGRERSRAEPLESAAWVVRELADFRVTEVRLVLAEDGYLQAMRVRPPSGVPADADDPAMIRVLVADGRITRIEEYTDPAHGSVPD